ncbi:TlpA family protein disulfide reductase [Paenibacillus psychroresistens]|uniref:TlpA family protein disulfide reductase n=1 Tax=Paenibacillus psychroresistens TaxID=1778678 RepID=A0A6B8RGJ9_9BACL|nr:TlpA disulfide reductase family protein [Paenibacillus psychroresistens]QGQ94653.1 TlpA family protein disulfide reductase [Paenibacillus psychroresistens]
MKSMFRIIVIVMLLTLVLYVSYQTFTKRHIQRSLTAAKSLSNDGRVPSILLKGLDEEEYQLGGSRVKPLIINFWASWCIPCQEEIPALQKIYDKYQSQLDLYAVNITMKDSLKEVHKFNEINNLNFPILLDSKGDAAKAFRVAFIPTTFLIDKKGNLKEAIHLLPPEQLEKHIQKLIDSAD